MNRKVQTHYYTEILILPNGRRLNAHEAGGRVFRLPIEPEKTFTPMDAKLRLKTIV